MLAAAEFASARREQRGGDDIYNADYGCRLLNCDSFHGAQKKVTHRLHPNELATFKRRPAAAIETNGWKQVGDKWMIAFSRSSLSPGLRNKRGDSPQMEAFRRIHLFN